MKELNMPEALIKGARDLYAKSEAVKSLLHGLMEEETRNQATWAVLWRAIDKEAKNQGIIKGDDEMYNFDVGMDKFTIIRK